MTGPIRDTKALGALIRKLRRERGVTQVQLAGLAGVGERFVSEVERGKSTAEVGLVMKLVERLGFRVYVGTPDEKR